MVPSPRAIVASVLRPVLRALEGTARPGPWRLPISGGWLRADEGQYWNFWQMRYSPISGERLAIIEAWGTTAAAIIVAAGIG